MKASAVYMRAAEIALATAGPSCICVSRAACGGRHAHYDPGHPLREEYALLFTLRGDCAPFAILDNPQEVRCLCLCMMAAISAYEEKGKS